MPSARKTAGKARSGALCVSRMLEITQQAIAGHDPQFQALLTELQITAGEYMGFIESLGAGIDYIYQHKLYKQASPDTILITRNAEPYARLRENGALEISTGYIADYVGAVRNRNRLKIIVVTGGTELTGEQVATLQGVECAYRVYQTTHLKEKYQRAANLKAKNKLGVDYDQLAIDARPIVRQAAIDLGIIPKR